MALASSEPERIGASRTLPESVNAAIIAFYKFNGRYLDNKPITRRTDRNILEAFRAHHGDKSVVHPRPAAGSQVPVSPYASGEDHQRPCLSGLRR